MTNDQQNEIKNVLLSARDDILRFRRENEILRAQSRVLDIFAAALLGKPSGFGYAEDTAWRIGEILKSLETPQSEGSKE